ncbi:MAG: YggS family pyridoxal phosphate-dependent enzyme [Deltaproteobacteria bacterium]|nr:YggS family pyridoxal phosphate-dependent enzyme [Deltaproteobacteria bacterium]
MAGTVSENYINVLDRIRKAARKAGRDPGEVTLVAVTKGVEIKKIKEAFSAGVRVFGENYVQEAEEKAAKVKDKSVRWHFIGHLQKNKVKLALELFDVIQTVEGPELAAEINKRATEPVDILLEVNIAREKTKAGVDAEGAVKLARTIPSMEKLRLRGLMTIPPPVENPEMSRPYFVALRRLAERINKERIPGVFLRDLSMGMSADFEVAVEEGATLIRVGTAIFGPRPEKKASKGA